MRLCTLLAVAMCLAACGNTAKTEQPPDAVKDTNTVQDVSSDTAREMDMESKTETNSADAHSLHLTGIENAWELGGYTGLDGRKIKSGLLLRTAATGNATDEDKQKLASLRLSLVVDFRGESERAAAPDMEMDGVRNESLPVLDASENATSPFFIAVNKAEMEARMDETIPDSAKGIATSIKVAEKGIALDQLYIGILDSNVGKAGYQKFFRLLLEQPEEEAVLWHCTEGKDRTGTAAALLMSVLGVDRETILDDYALTNVFLSERVSNAKQMASAITDDEDLINKASEFTGVSRMFMEKTLEWLDENYGSPVEYVKTVLELSDEDISAPQEKYLETAK